MSLNTPARARRGRTRMTSAQRREQLIGVARSLFAERGYEGTSVEEIAASAGVSKPVVYEHFGGKEGLYAVVVDREATRLDHDIRKALTMPNVSYRDVLELGTLALLDYIEECPEGFRILSRDTGPGASGSYASILSDITASVEGLLMAPLERHGFEPRLASVFAQSLVGIVSMAGQIWVENQEFSKDDLAAQMVNLAWNGLSRLEHSPGLRTRGTLADDKTPEAPEA